MLAFHAQHSLGGPPAAGVGVGRGWAEGGPRVTDTLAQGTRSRPLSVSKHAFGVCPVPGHEHRLQPSGLLEVEESEGL